MTGMIADLKQLYGEWLKQVPADRRGEVFRHVQGMVDNVDYVSFNAFLPFVVEDDDRGIVATAVIDYVSLASPTGDDPMSRPRDIVELIEGGMLKNQGAAFGALLHIGDPRVCKLIWPLRDALEADAVGEVIHCETGFIPACTAEFYIDWLEGMEGDTLDGQFGLVASGLALLRKRSAVDEVFTGLRPFPFTKSMTLKRFGRQRSRSLLQTTRSASLRAYTLSNAQNRRRGHASRAD